MARVDVFLDEVPVCEIREGIVYISASDGECLAIPLRKFRLGMARGARALAEHDARKAEVVELKGKRRNHAART